MKNILPVNKMWINLECFCEKYNMTSHFCCLNLKKYCHSSCTHTLEKAATPRNFYRNNFQNILQVFPCIWIPCLWMIQDIFWWIVLLVVLGTWKSHIRQNRGSIVDIPTQILVFWKNIALAKCLWIKGFYNNAYYTSLTKDVVP